MLEVSDREEGVVALHLPTGPLKTRSELEPVPRCEPSTYQPSSNTVKKERYLIRQDNTIYNFLAKLPFQLR